MQEYQQSTQNFVFHPVWKLKLQKQEVAVHFPNFWTGIELSSMINFLGNLHLFSFVCE